MLSVIKIRVMLEMAHFNLINMYLFTCCPEVFSPLTLNDLYRLRAVNSLKIKIHSKKTPVGSVALSDLIPALTL
jgi:hypothetical protein